MRLSKQEKLLIVAIAVFVVTLAVFVVTLLPLKEAKLL